MVNMYLTDLRMLKVVGINVKNLHYIMIFKNFLNFYLNFEMKSI